MTQTPNRWLVLVGDLILLVIGWWIGTIVQPHWALGTLAQPYRIIVFFLCSFVVMVIAEQAYRAVNKGVPPRLFDSWTTAFIVGFFLGAVLIVSAK